MDQDAIDKANKLYDRGSMPRLYNFIKPFLEADDPYALYLSSRFSLSKWKESDEEYDKRYVDSLTKAAEGNVAEAMHQLAALYFVGDGVELDVEKGKSYLDSAMRLNYGIAKFSVGINTYYGSNGYSKDIEKAFELVSEAVQDNVEDAPEVLEKLKLLSDQEGLS